MLHSNGVNYRGCGGGVNHKNVASAINIPNEMVALWWLRWLGISAVARYSVMDSVFE